MLVMLFTLFESHDPFLLHTMRLLSLQLCSLVAVAELPVLSRNAKDSSLSAGAAQKRQQLRRRKRIQALTDLSRQPWANGPESRLVLADLNRIGRGAAVRSAKTLMNIYTQLLQSIHMCRLDACLDLLSRAFRTSATVRVRAELADAMYSVLENNFDLYRQERCVAFYFDVLDKYRIPPTLKQRRVKRD
eukprot:TRINITY_DN105155_c0_g1_i1.p1 TRINITY_DN105155_c0_g1~~TRINITY_DN105155_c0_g1_i1.p1  ORF type:complete len:200 (-),score=91.58 TRINITY_DN105155_c0_g1_i1:48-614(-)